MQTHRRSAALLALLTSLIAPAGAFAANPAKNARFKGTASGTVQFAASFTAKDPLSFKIASGGKDLLSFAYTDNVCGLASSKLVSLPTIKLSPSGTFSLSKRKSAPEPDSLKDGGTILTTTTLSGRFTSAKRATGTLEYTQQGSGAPASKCGPIKLKFTASAP